MTGKTKKESVPGFAFVKRAHGIAEYTLKKNGLTVLIGEDHSAPLVGVNIHYNVGSRHEHAGNTGATHLLEHMLFKGSKNFSKKHGNFWNALMDTGTVINATTWLDRTHYYEIGPKEHLTLFLEAEADRMRHALIKEADLVSEMPVVRNEYERNENEPIDALEKAVWATAFMASGYHHPTIGWKSDIEHASAESLRAFYDSFYYPDNAAVVVIGDIDPKKVLQLIAQLFGKHPRAPREISAADIPEPPQEGPRSVTVERFGGKSIVQLAHRIPRALHADTPALIALAELLGGSATSRLHRALVDTGFATNVSMYAHPHKNEHLLSSIVTFDPQKDHAFIERIVREEYARIAEKGPTKTELPRVAKRYEVSATFERDGLFMLLQTLTEALAAGDWRLFFELPGKIKAVTTEDVTRVARTYLTGQNETMGYFKPKKEASPV